jgi:hypothetical protein
MPRLAHVLAPRERLFFELFEEAAENSGRAARLLEQVFDEWPDHGEVVREIVVCEREGDRIVSDVRHRLQETFVTPVDRKDIHRLVRAIDDVVDRIEEAAGLLDAYRLDIPLAEARHQAWILDYACRAIAAAMPRLRSFKDMSELTATVGTLEHQADRFHRQALAALFAEGIDPLYVMRRKDVLEALKHAIDASRRVAGALEDITIKNA